MCVTNTTHRRTQAISLNPAQVNGIPSVLSQRLMGGFSASIPTSIPKPAIAQPVTEQYVVVPPVEKPRAKRRRKPQKPGKTAKMNDRHFVVHNYHDHVADPTDADDEEEQNQRRRGGVAVAFPLKLHAVLDQVEADGLAHVVSWQPHGRCFVIHNAREFVDHVMPRYFRQTKLTSFQRQLNLYGFSRLTKGADAGGYYHELFLRGKVALCKKMCRTKVKGTKFKAASSPENEPDFYKMKPVVVSPHNSSDEEMSHHSQQTYDTLTQNNGARMQQFQPPKMESLQGTAQQQLFFDPLPYQYQESAPSQPVPMSFPSLSSFLRPCQTSAAPIQRNPAEDTIFDEAVDELFLDEGANEINVNEFVLDWDPSINMEPILQDDAQLGYFLEKLLED